MPKLVSSLTFVDLLLNALKRGLNSYVVTLYILDLLFCCLCDYVLMKQNHHFCMINCTEDRISLHSYTYLVSEIMAIHMVSSRDPKILASINCILLLLFLRLIATYMHSSLGYSRLNEFCWLVNLLSNFEAFLYYVTIFLS